MGDHIFHGLHCKINCVVAVSIMFVISWKMALVVISLSPVCLLVIRIQSFYAGKLAKDRSDAINESSNLVRETLSHLTVVRSLAAEARQAERYKDLASDVYDLSLQSGMVNATSKSSATLVVQLAVALSLYVAGLAVLTRQVEVLLDAPRACACHQIPTPCLGFCLSLLPPSLLACRQQL